MCIFSAYYFNECIVKSQFPMGCVMDQSVLYTSSENMIIFVIKYRRVHVHHLLSQGVLFVCDVLNPFNAVHVWDNPMFTHQTMCQHCELILWANATAPADLQLYS